MRLSGAPILRLMLPLLVLLAAGGAGDAPWIGALAGRVLVVDARRVESCAPGEVLRAADEGTLELGAASRASLRVPGRMSFECAGPAACEWSPRGLRLLRVDAANWEWRGEPQDLRLPDGLRLHGGPGAYELRADVRGLDFAVHAGAPLELWQDARLLARATQGVRVRVGREAWSSAPPPAHPAWTSHEWPAAAAPVSSPLDSPPPVDLWRPAQWRCSASARPPVFRARIVAPELPSGADAQEPSAAEPAAPPVLDGTPESVNAPESVVEAPPQTESGPEPLVTPVETPPVEAPPVVAAQPAPALQRPAAERSQHVRWPSWFARPVLSCFARLQAFRDACRGFLARYEAQEAFGVRFDPFAPFQVELQGDRLSLLLDPRATRVEQVRGTSLLLVPPGAAVVLERGGRLESYAGKVLVKPLRRR